jgi:hypothetical protein
MSRVPGAARDILGAGTLCYLAARTEEGLHVTPVVFVLDGGRVWATTARRTVKARAWKGDRTAAGLVRLGDRAVSFRGKVTLYDALDPRTWPASVLRGPALARASTRFTVKNARFFAGYARDARRVPFSWTPPGRIAVSVELEAGAVLDLERGEVEERWGPWGDAVEGRATFRRTSRSRPPEAGAPAELRRGLGSAGPGALGVEGKLGPAVLPARWVRSEGTHYVVLPRPVLALAEVRKDVPAALVLDRASAWRASRMRGILLRGDAQVYLPDGMRSGREALLAHAGRAGTLPTDPAVLRIHTRTAVWWEGWASGTVGRR